MLRGDVVKDDSGSNAVFTEQGSSASHMTAAKVPDLVSSLPGCAMPSNPVHEISSRHSGGQQDPRLQTKVSAFITWDHRLITGPSVKEGIGVRFLV